MKIHRIPRPVPWGGFDVFAVIFLSVFAASLAAFCVPVSEEPNQTEITSQEHPLIPLICNAENGLRLQILFASFLLAVVVAPLSEELLFRVVIQGYFEKKELLSRYNFGKRLKWQPFGFMPVVFSSLLFALLHIREENPDTIRTIENLFRLIQTQLIAGTITFFLVIVFLKMRGAKHFDLGIRFRSIPRDIAVGIGCFIICLPVLAATHWTAKMWLSSRFADPVVIFVLALGLGCLYMRNHRFAQIFAMHAALNAYSFVMCLK